MTLNLSNSGVKGQNILSSQYAVEEIRENIEFCGTLAEGQYHFIIKQVADFFEVEKN